MKFFQADLLSTSLPVAHGCNAQGKFRSGVAGAIAAKHPEVRNGYLKYVDAYGIGPHLLGKWCRVIVDDKHFYNCITQEFYGRDGKKYASYLAIIQSLVDIITTHNITELAIPKIGCGLGGLEWETVNNLLLEIEDQYDMEFSVYSI